MSPDTGGVTDAAAAHGSDVDAAITRASRASAEARERSENFRERTGTHLSHERTRP